MKTNNRILILLLLAGLGAGILPMQAQSRKKGLRKGPNVSLNITNRKKPVATTYFNFGLFSNFSRLGGVGINAISSVVHHRTEGVQVSGLANVTGLNVSGVQMTGLVNVTGRNSNGLVLSGLMNVNGWSAKGVQLSGLGNVAGKDLKGVTLSGLVSIGGRNTSGLQIAGLSNISAENHYGVAVAGLMNVAGGNVCGLQLTSLLNIAGKENRGVQLAGLGNVSVENKGLQLGFTNYSAQNNGLQAGFGNIANKCEKGLQLGIVNVSQCNRTRQIGCVNVKPETRIQMLLSGGNASKLNLGVRFKNRYTYTILGTGAYHLGMDKDFSVSGFYRAGVHYPLTARLDLSADLGFYHIETLDNKHDGYPARLYALQPRLNLEYSITRRVGVFASGGYEWLRQYQGKGKFDDKGVFEVGLVLF